MRHAKAVFADEHRKVFDMFQYSPAVKAGPYVYISGVIGADERGCAFDTPEAEYHAAFQTILKLLDASGATAADIISLDSFHVTDDLIREMRTFNQVRADYMSAPHPAWTAIGVCSIAVPGARAEIKVTAYLGNQDI